MAIWQCDFQLVPRERLAGASEDLPLRLNETEAEETDWWSEAQPRSDCPVLLSAVLPVLSRDPEYRQWGTDDGDRVDVFLEHGRVTGIRIRVDMRQPNAAFIEGVRKLAHHCDAVLIDETLAVLPPEPAILAIALQHSRAARFLRDPETYFQRLSIGGVEDA